MTASAVQPHANSAAFVAAGLVLRNYRQPAMPTPSFCRTPCTPSSSSPSETACTTAAKIRLVLASLPWPQVLAECHESAASGHLGRDANLAQLQRRFWWLPMQDMATAKLQRCSMAVLMYRLSKMVRFVPTRKSVSAQQLARLFFDRVVKLHGFPESIVSDSDPRFRVASGKRSSTRAPR